MACRLPAWLRAAVEASMMGHMRAALASGDQTPLRGAFKRLENYAGEVAREAQERAGVWLSSHARHMCVCKHISHRRAF